MSESPGESSALVTLPLDLAGLEDLARDHGPLRLRIGGLPPSVRPSAGTRQADGTWLVGAADWPGLALIAAPDVPDFDLELIPEQDPGSAPPAPSATQPPSDPPSPAPPNHLPPMPLQSNPPNWGVAAAYAAPIVRRTSWIDAIDDVE